METARPITTEEARSIRASLAASGSQDVSDIMLFMQTSLLRVGDACAVKWTDINDMNWLKVIESKTGKIKECALHPAMLEVLARRRAEHPKDVFIFQSHNHKILAYGKVQPITRAYVSRKIAEAAKALGMKGCISSHSARKAGAVQVFNASNIVQAAAALGHSSTETTMRYMDINKNLTSSYLTGMEI
ncbi:hypothetical protein SR70_06680 [Klebsiella aerogenes]|uniref:tyrosine-type recombinase/integrase n=1 Tax=Klebsiella aerogenes TaxID=548 RepID=UPI0005EEB6AD|nr:tyrosine-type recombinase/integrase [Klebsiella aerogenes]KJP43151.1 hypothetical protein SR70_06680 [Klebsiella aerogenes]